MIVFALAPHDLRQCWEDFAPLLGRLERESGEPRAAQVREAALASKCQVFGLRDDAHRRVAALTVTEIHTLPAGKFCRIVGTASLPGISALEHKAVLNEIGRWAASIGCRSVQLLAPRGPLRRLFRRAPAVVDEWPLAPAPGAAGASL